MKVFEYGIKFDETVPARPGEATPSSSPGTAPPSPVALPFAVETCDGWNAATEPVTFQMTIPTYTLATHAKWELLHIVCLAPGGELSPNPQDMLGSVHPVGTVDVSGSLGGTFSVAVPTLPVVGQAGGPAMFQVIREGDDGRA